MIQLSQSFYKTPLAITLSILFLLPSLTFFTSAQAMQEPDELNFEKLFEKSKKNLSFKKKFDLRKAQQTASQEALSETDSDFDEDRENKKFGLPSHEHISLTSDQQIQQNNLLWRALTHPDLSAVRNALDAGAHVDTKSKHSYRTTPLMHASYYSNVNIVSLLLDRKATINMTNDCAGETSVIIAAKQECFRVVQMLIVADADLTIANKYGITAFNAIATEQPSTNILIEPMFEDRREETQHMKNCIKITLQEKDLLGQQDWFPTTLQKSPLFNELFPAALIKIITGYAHTTSSNKTLNAIIRKQIKRNKKHNTF